MVSMSDVPGRVASPLDYHIAMQKLAQINYICNKSNQRQSLNRDKQCLDRITALMNSLPPVLQKESNSKGYDAPPWAFFQSHLINCTAQFMRLSLAQKSFSHWSKTQPVSNALRTIASDAASAIIQQMTSSTNLLYRRSWCVIPVVGLDVLTLPRISVSATLAAGVFLAIDEMCFAVPTAQSLSNVTACREILTSVKEFSVVARQGERILEKLLAMAAVGCENGTASSLEDIMLVIANDRTHVDKSISNMETHAFTSEKSWLMPIPTDWPLNFDFEALSAMDNCIGLEQTGANLSFDDLQTWL